MVFSFFRRDPTAAWPAVAAVPLCLDTTKGTVNGLPLGAPVAAIAQFGRPDNRNATRNDTYEYRALSLTVRTYDGRVDHFIFSFDDPLHPDFGACTLEVVLPRGKSITLTRATHQADLERALGRSKALPAEGEEDEEERILKFTTGMVCLLPNVARDGRLRALDVDPRAPED